MDIIRKKPISVYNDTYNSIVFKPSTNKVVIGTNTGSRGASRYKSFKCKTKEDAKRIGFDYINKYSKVKISD